MTRLSDAWGEKQQEQAETESLNVCDGDSRPIWKCFFASQFLSKQICPKDYPAEFEMDEFPMKIE